MKSQSSTCRMAICRHGAGPIYSATYFTTFINSQELLMLFSEKASNILAYL